MTRLGKLFEAGALKWEPGGGGHLGTGPGEMRRDVFCCMKLMSDSCSWEDGQAGWLCLSHLCLLTFRKLIGEVWRAGVEARWFLPMGALQFQKVGGKGFIGTMRVGWILQGLVVEHPPVKSRDVPWPRETHQPPSSLAPVLRFLLTPHGSACPSGFKISFLLLLLFLS